MWAFWNIHVAALAVTAQSTLPSCTELGFSTRASPSRGARTRRRARGGRARVYLHIAKCAGTSVAVHLSALLDDPPAASARARSAPRPRRGRSPTRPRGCGTCGRGPAGARRRRRAPRAAADVASIERDAAWRDPRGRAPRAAVRHAPRADVPRAVALRAPPPKRRIHQAHQISAVPARVCARARRAPDAARCKVECRQFFNLQTFMLVGNAGDRLPARAAATTTRARPPVRGGPRVLSPPPRGSGMKLSPPFPHLLPSRWPQLAASPRGASACATPGGRRARASGRRVAAAVRRRRFGVFRGRPRGSGMKLGPPPPLQGSRCSSGSSSTCRSRCARSTSR